MKNTAPLFTTHEHLRSKRRLCKNGVLDKIEFVEKINCYLIYRVQDNNSAALKGDGL